MGKWIILDFWQIYNLQYEEQSWETMRLDHQADHEKKYKRTNEIEPEEYQQILCVRRIRAIDPGEWIARKKEGESKQRMLRN